MSTYGQIRLNSHTVNWLRCLVVQDKMRHLCIVRVARWPMVRPKNRLPSLLLVVATLLGIMIGLPVNVVSDYLPAAVVGYKGIWIAGLLILALAIGCLTWAIPRLQERRPVGALFSVPVRESWIDRPELETVITELTKGSKRFAPLSRIAQTVRRRIFPPVGKRVLIASWGEPKGPGRIANDACVVAIFGHGGAGKTSLATTACYSPDVRRYFKGGVLWITLGRDKGGLDLVERINGAVAEISELRPVTSDPEQASHYLKRALADRKMTLLVVDDVWDDQELELFLPNESTYRLLFTTQVRALVPHYACPVSVDHLFEGTASRILCDGLPVLPLGAEGKLLDVAGRLPLLLSLMNRRLREEVARGGDISLAVDQAIGRLREKGPAAFDMRSRTVRKRLVADTMEYSLGILEPQERERFLELSIFPQNTDVPIEVVELLWSETGQLTSPETVQLCERLEELSLVSRKWNHGRQLLVLHATVRAYARVALTAEEVVRCNTRLLEALPVNSADASGKRRWWSVLVGSDYFWENLVYHFKEAALADELQKIVCDLRWLSGRVARSGVSAAEKDLSELRTPLADKLCSVILQNIHLFDPADPVEVVAATLVTRLHDMPELSEGIREYVESSAAWHLSPRWPFPDQSPDPWLAVRGHRSSVAAIAVASGGSWFASAGLDGVLSRWSVEGLQQTTLIAQCAGMTSVAIAPTGNWMVAGDSEGVVHVVAAGGGDVVSMRGHQDAVNSIAISRDGSWFASAGNDGSILLWGVDGSRQGRLYARRGEVQAVAIPGMGPWLASADSDGAVRLWDEGGGISRVIFDRSQRLRDLAISPDGQWLAAVGDLGVVQLWHSDGRERAVLWGHRGVVRKVAIAPDGEWLVSGGMDGTLRLWTADATRRRVAECNCGGVSALAIEPRGAWLVSGGLDGSLQIWKPEALWRMGSASHGVDVRSVAVSPDGTWLASACSDGSVRLWDANGASRELLGRHGRWTSQVAIATDGTWFASAGWDGQVRLWAPDGSQRGMLAGHRGGATAVAIAPDGSWLAAADWSGSVRVWDVDYRETRRVLTGSRLWVSSIAIAPDGAWWVTAAEDGALLLWEEDGSLRGELRGHQSGIRSVAIAPDGSWLVSADTDGEMRLWDVKGSLRCVLSEGDGAIESVAISFDGSLIAAAYTNGLVRLWDPHRASSLTVVRLSGPLRSCAWFPGTLTLCVTGAKGMYCFTANGPPATGERQLPT
ncbi:NB-ARC domain-containing protein [Nonomuraea sp. CA-143628]|uniref:NB-ARC domain-containing protein n=1 Tax=Nonomuraea sp. CA-143628 TaxID=3239997 RepID=UPI003D8B5306